MAQAPVSLPLVRGMGETSRRDSWWWQPLLVVGVLSSFLAYSTWAAFQNDHYTKGPYLSPFYSPVLFADPPHDGQEPEQKGRAEQHMTHSLFGARPGWWPGWIPFSPALLILAIPGGFRFTCYYYRGAYYKGFWADPPACAVGEPRSGYRGERSLPLILQNVHRYFLYLAGIFLLFLAWDALQSFWYKGALGIGVGSLVLTMNVCLLGGYTLSCHSLRHLIGGRLDEVSKSPARFKAYNCVSCLNSRHMLWAWFSLFWVAFSDLYVRLCSMGYWGDLNTWGSF